MTWNYTSFSFYLLQLPRNSLKCSLIVTNGDKTDFKFCREYQVARYCDYLEIKYRKNCVKIEEISKSNIRVIILYVLKFGKSTTSF